MRETTLALGIVVRDDLLGVEGIIKQLGSLFDEIIIIVDSATQAILMEFERLAAQYNDNARIIPSTESIYTQARNQYLENCSSDWLLVLDSDELISFQGLTNLREELYRVQPSVGALRLPILNYSGRGRWLKYTNARAVRIGKGFIYDDYVHHNGLDTSVIGAGYSIGMTRQFIEHFGSLRCKLEKEKRIRRSTALREQLEVKEASSIRLAIIAVEHFSLGMTKCALDYIDRAILKAEDLSEGIGLAHYLKALFFTLLKLDWLAREELERIPEGNQHFQEEIALLVAELDLRESGERCALRHLEPFLEHDYLNQNPSSVQVLLNAAYIAERVVPEKAIEWGLKAIEMLPRLESSEIYKLGLPYNPYSFQEPFLAGYTNIFSILKTSYALLGNKKQSQQWSLRESEIIHVR